MNPVNGWSTRPSSRSRATPLSGPRWTRSSSACSAAQECAISGRSSPTRERFLEKERNLKLVAQDFCRNSRHLRNVVG